MRVFSKRRLLEYSASLGGQFVCGTRKFGLIHHTTGQFRKGTKGNLPFIHQEMPFRIGVAFSDDLDWL